MKDDRGRIGSVNGLDENQGAPFWRDHGPVHDGIKSVLYICRRERPAVMEFHAGSQMKNISLRIGSLPFFGQVGPGVPFGIKLNKSVKNQIINSFRLRVDSDSRIEIGR